ncbi:MAG: hypothetical protein ACD_12C00310G0004 [uncultured bacterium]|nr:MAG: hypothetical protein ACD_12C00310G0004 [uncultured bacterium]
MKKILITGTSGMLGATLVNLWNKKYHVYATSGSNFSNNPAVFFKEFDLKTRNYQSLLQWVKPDVILHCAAITSHEYCQNNPKEAMLVNGESVKKLIEVFPESKLIFISTDAVFPLNTHLAGEKTKTIPSTIYGKSKELGEKNILNLARNGYVIRTTIIGKNINTRKQSFVEWIINSLRGGKMINLYDNTLFTPISIWHFAQELEWIINNKVPKILHVAGDEIISKYTLGYNLAKKLNLDLNLIKKGKLIQKDKIKRSKDQTLDCSYYQSISKRNLPNIKDTLEILVKNYK